MHVDIIHLSRDDTPIRPDVHAGIKAQRGVTTQLHRVFGTPQPSDASRFEAIVRGRNAGRHIGSAPYVFLIDDDVVLEPGCLARLVQSLESRPEFAAMAADCTGSMEAGWDHWDYPSHVTMASILFRRRHLASLTFRWQPGQCDCRCACDDLRRDSLGVGYVPGALAWHLPNASAPTREPSTPSPEPAPTRSSGKTGAGRVLCAFDRNHVSLFHRRFLATFRGQGNQETVTAVTYGLYPSEIRRLALTPAVEVEVAPNDGNPARCRPKDFARILAGLASETPVAYWDTPDIVFQRPIAELWDLVRAAPDRIQVAEEVLQYGQNHVADDWILSIRDSKARYEAFELLKGRHTLNSGFIAGTAATLRRYFLEADRLMNSPAMLGCSDWGDQSALNIICYSQPDRWIRCASTWNFCLVGLRPEDFRVRPDGCLEDPAGTLLHVVHGNGKTFGPLTLGCLAGAAS